MSCHLKTLHFWPFPASTFSRKDCSFLLFGPYFKFQRQSRLGPWDRPIAEVPFTSTLSLFEVVSLVRGRPLSYIRTAQFKPLGPFNLTQDPPFKLKRTQLEMNGRHNDQRQHNTKQRLGHSNHLDYA